MPDVVTHATFAIDVMNKLEIDSIKDILKDNKYIYYLGAQGPDVFYFHQLFSIKKNKAYSHFGNYMHDNKTQNFLVESAKYLKEHYSEALHAYLCGFICHHGLDRNVHPYVYHFTGKGDIKYRGNHLRLERAVDSWFIMNRWNKPKPHLFKIHQQILNYNLDQAIFSPYYETVLNTVYNKKQGGKAFMNAARNFRRYAKILFDKHGYKKKFARFIDKHFNKKSKLVLETLCYYDNINKDIDYMNLKRKTWNHPVLNHMRSTDTFLDLYEKGVIETKNEISALDLFLNDKIDEKGLRSFLLDLSYSTGLDCSENNEMKHFNAIF